ncbi:sodium-dependent multivitamin transporter-like isoform X1 [Dreissena polymorpha]|nr:sodium-dependent multivitamin transporter-like isoform X1 [Dreissena polymorpha]
MIMIAFGLLCLTFAFLVSLLGTMILTLAYVLFGVLGGPLLGIFCLGMLFPWANKWGGFAGLASSLSFLIWIGLGQAITGTSVVITPPVESVGCNWTAINKPTPSTLIPTTTPDFAHPVTSDYDKYDGINRLYTVSYMWYSAIAVLTCVVIGLLVSIITGIRDPKELDPKLVCPFFDIFCPYLPETMRRPLRFGVRHGEEVPEEVTSEKRRERLASLHLNDDIGKRASKDSDKADSVNIVNGTPGEKFEGVENNGYEPQGYEIGNGSTRYQTRL